MQDLRRYNARWHRWARFVAQRLVLAPVVRTVTKVTVEGGANLDGLDQPFVVVTNHASHLDAPLVVTSLPYRFTRSLAVAAAADYFYRRWWIKASTSLFFNSYPVHRTRADVGKSKALSLRLIEAGIPVLIFPEGTRTRDGSLKHFKPGAAALCVSQDVPCVPIAILGTRAAMPVGRFWPVPGRPAVTMLVGRPLHSRPGENIRDFNNRVEAAISAMMTMHTPYVLGDGRPADDHPDPTGQAQEEAS